MNITKTDLSGVLCIDIEAKTDNRGFFARTWDAAFAKENALVERFDYSCISGNTKMHTLRGMHWQKAPHGETKLVRCTRGRMLDVVVDLRPESSTFQAWTSVELSSKNHQALYIPEGFAHGFLTLEDATEVLYDIAGAYVPDASAGVRFDDPAFSIVWPAAPAIISGRDASYPDFL